MLFRSKREGKMVMKKHRFRPWPKLERGSLQLPWVREKRKPKRSEKEKRRV